MNFSVFERKDYVEQHSDAGKGDKDVEADIVAKALLEELDKEVLGEVSEAEGEVDDAVDAGA